MRVLLLMPTSTYKSADFLAAAERLGVEVVVGSERRQALEGLAVDSTLTVGPAHPELALERIADLHRRKPLDAVVGTDDETAVLAAQAAQTLGLGHNPPDAVLATRDKHAMRGRLAQAGLRGPRYRQIDLGQDPRVAAAETDYPCVLKPLSLSASRGVIRADDPVEFVRAHARIVEILARAANSGVDRGTALLVEDYLPGGEVALEGLLDNGRLRVLALFDKPDPLEGPTFEETIYVTPSRLSSEVRQAIAQEAESGCRALGLVAGPVHAELRVADGLPTVLEIAARTIGGLCSRTLRFGAGVSLEELVLRHALGKHVEDLGRESLAAGVMMIPTPGAGVLRKVRGIEDARATPGIVELTLSVPRGATLVPWPEGHRYLGFIFARGASPEFVEQALRTAHARLDPQIDSAG